MLVSEVIERTYNDWFFPAGINRPAYDKLTAGIDNVTLTIPLSGRVANVPADTVLEIASEQILVESVAGTTVTAKERGWLETGAAAHALGDIVWVDPTFTRKSIFNALIAIIRMLYPAGVYARLVDSTTTFSMSSPTKNLPAGGKKILKIVTDAGGTIEDWNTLRAGIDYVEFLEFTPPKYRLYRGGKADGPMRVVYKADFTIPTAETDNLSSTAAPVPDSLQDHLPIGIAGYLLQGRELPRVQLEEIKRMLAAQGVQVGAAMNVGQVMVRTFMAQYVAAERDRLKETDSMGIEFVRR